MSPWTGDWAGRITEFAQRKGHRDIWEYLRAHPGVPLTEIADTIGDAAAIQVHQILVKHCLAGHMMGDLVCDLMARSIRGELPNGWGAGTDFEHSRATQIGILPEPFATLSSELGLWLFRGEAPPRGWLPASGDDETLRRGYQRALEALPPDRRRRVELGEIEPRPGDMYWSKVEPIWKKISIYEGETVFLEQFSRVPRRLGDLFAAHWCQSEVCNGGLHQFFANSTGVLAPEAVAGFRAIGMTEVAALVEEAMRILGTSYPRDRETRQGILPRASRFRELDERFFARLQHEADGFAVAADRYALTLA
jgi:hypothetical protein